MKRIALITGGTRGIGYGIALALARQGLDLALCGRRPEQELGDALDGLRATGATVHYQPADIGDDQDREILIDGVRERYGRLDVLVNNAGIGPRERRDILEADESSFDEVMRVNVSGPYFLTQRAARWLVEQKRADSSFRGCIITVGSVSATLASVQRGEYCVAKAGLAMATRLWAVRLAEYDIPVYEIRPGITRTDMTAGVADAYDALIAEGLVPQRRWGTPDDVGAAAAMLVRGDLAFSTGQVVMVDGGLTLGRL
jgi:3-oxoacyl-[acyl-carrier protein] reductase